MLPTPHTHPFNGPFPGLPRSAGTRKVKPIWILLKQQTVSGSGISWAICKSARRSRQITTPTPHHSVFYRPDALPATQPTVSKHSRLLSQSNKTKFANRKKIQFSSYKYFLIISYAFRAWNAFSALTMWLGARKSIRPIKIWETSVVICLKWGADCLHMVPLMSLPSQNPINYCLI